MLALRKPSVHCTRVQQSTARPQQHSGKNVLSCCRGVLLLSNDKLLCSISPETGQCLSESAQSQQALSILRLIEQRFLWFLFCFLEWDIRGKSGSIVCLSIVLLTFVEAGSLTYHHGDYPHPSQQPNWICHVKHLPKYTNTREGRMCTLININSLTVHKTSPVTGFCLWGSAASRDYPVVL